MDIIKNTKCRILEYNTLIKYHIKADKEGVSSEKRMSFALTSPPVLDVFRTEVLQKLKAQDYSDDFIKTINQLYQLSQTNSDLVATHGYLIRQLHKDYPLAKELEPFSFEIYEFIRNDIFKATTPYDIPIIYNGFEDILTNIPEYRFRDNPYILWETFYFVLPVIDSYLKQQIKDLRNQTQLLPEDKIQSFRQEQKELHLKQVTELINGFCDRNFVFEYLKGTLLIDKEYIIGSVLSDMFENLDEEEYVRYIEFNYSTYTHSYWEFEKKALSGYKELASLPQFEHLIFLLNHIFLTRELGKPDIEDHLAVERPLPKRRSTGLKDHNLPDILTNDVIIDKPGKRSNVVPEVTYSVKADYIQDVSILVSIYEEFNTVLWEDIGLPDFLDVFRNDFEAVPTFKIRDVSCFYYLLKYIWRNRPDKSTFRYEKEWLIPFLEIYNLSHSSYSNQFIEKEGAYKHRRFIETVKNIFKDSEKNTRK